MNDHQAERTDDVISDQTESAGVAAVTVEATPQSDQPPVPLIIGVTGHRNLVETEIPRLKKMVRGFLMQLSARYPHMPLAVMTPLAEGADRLVAREAMALGLQLIVPIPMPRDLYIDDFTTAESREEFEQICRVSEVIELPIMAGQSRHLISQHGAARSAQYAQMGIFVCAHCHLLLAIWDGKPSDKLGGTAQVVQFHHWDTMPGFTEEASNVRQILADDESDLVYHIVCSRDQPDGEPADPLQPLETAWLTTDTDQPRTGEIPARYEEIFARTSQFNHDAVRHADKIASEAWPLLTDDAPDDLPPAAVGIDRMFRIADWLAIRYQKRVTSALRLTYSLAVLMGLAFIAYSDLPEQDTMIYAFLAFFAVGFCLFYVADKRAWHRKYLDYRALAEGLRVQFYWALAGVAGEQHTKFAHDNFLQKQDVELGWIRNVMRVAGRTGDVEQSGSHGDGLDYTIQEWVGNPDKGFEGQLGYYARKTEERTHLSRLTSRIGLACLWSGITVTLILAFFSDRITGISFDILIVLMGILPLTAAVREAYAQKRAEKELIKQYRFMSRIFSNAKRLLDEATSDREKQQILKALGDAALDEHAEWLLMHRERPLEHGKL